MATPSGGSRPPDTRASGQVLAYERKDGLTSWYLRVRADGRRHRINLGTELDRLDARARQDRVAERPRRRSRPAYGSRRHRRRRRSMTRPSTSSRRAGWLVAGRRYKQRTYEHYRYLLTHHLLPAFAALRLSQLDYAAIDRYVEAKQLESEEIREATRRGVTLTDANGRRKRPLANSTINATVELLIGVLDEAVRRKLLVVNPAERRGCG